jgi:hypothetical protein
MADYEEMTVEELKDELSARDLPVSGNKAELVERLEENDAEGPVEAETADEGLEVADYKGDDLVAQALALEEPLKALADALASGPNSDALKSGIRSASRGLGHMRKALDQMERLAER